ncbi:MAG TPA: hypothetical protein VI256_11255, partial [Roseiarcus sp.]
NQTISTSNEPAAPPKKWKRHFERGTPKDALTWKNARQRSIRMFGWQVAVSTEFPTSVRIVRIAWLLSSLCQKEGYAFATDAYISETLGIPLNKVQQALTELQGAGAIVRASSFVDGIAQRKIWPSTKIIPPTAGGMDTPRDDRVDTPHGGGRDSIQYTRSRKSSRISSTAEDAKRDAERRERRRATASDDDGQDTPSDERGAPQARPRAPSEFGSGEVTQVEALEAEIVPDDIETGALEAPPRPIVVQMDAVPDGLILDENGVEYRPPPPHERRPPPKDWMSVAMAGMNRGQP